MLIKYEPKSKFVNQIPRVEPIIIFTDAATSAKTMVSIGAFLCLDQYHIEQYSKCTPEELFTKLADIVVYKEYKSKKSTWSEIQTVVDALHVVLSKSGPDRTIEIYTDCKSLCDLMSRRKEKLKKTNFITRSGKVLQNADLYKELFAISDKFQIKIFKIKGHDRSAYRLSLHEKIFAVLDKLSRKKLRSILK